MHQIISKSTSSQLTKRIVSIKNCILWRLKKYYNEVISCCWNEISDEYAPSESIITSSTRLKTFLFSIKCAALSSLLDILFLFNWLQRLLSIYLSSENEELWDPSSIQNFIFNDIATVLPKSSLSLNLGYCFSFSDSILY